MADVLRYKQEVMLHSSLCLIDATNVTTIRPFVFMRFKYIRGFQHVQIRYSGLCANGIYNQPRKQDYNPAYDMMVTPRGEDQKVMVSTAVYQYRN